MRKGLLTRANVHGENSGVQENLCAFADRPVAFFARYVRLHRWTHAVILSSVASWAVLCSVFAQYGVKFLVDTLSQPARDATLVWLAFAILVTLIAADNLLWRPGRLGRPLDIRGRYG